MKYTEIKADVEWKTFELIEHKDGDFISLLLKYPIATCCVITLKPNANKFCYVLRVANDQARFKGCFEYKNNPRMNLRDFATHALSKIKEDVAQYVIKMNMFSEVFVNSMIDCGVFENKTESNLRNSAIQDLLQYTKNPTKFPVLD